MAPDAERSDDSRSNEEASKGFWSRTWVIATAITAVCAAIGGVIGLLHLLPSSSAPTASYQRQVVTFCHNLNALNLSYNGAAIDQSTGNYIKAGVVSDMRNAVQSGRVLVASLASITPPSSLGSKRRAALRAWAQEERATATFAGYIQSHLPTEFTTQQLQAAETAAFPRWRSLLSAVNAAFSALAGQYCQALT